MFDYFVHAFFLVIVVALLAGVGIGILAMFLYHHVSCDINVGWIK